jgi:hypothetical protein
MVTHEVNTVTSYLTEGVAKPLNDPMTSAFAVDLSLEQGSR